MAPAANTAAWLLEEKAKTVTVKSADYPSPADDELVVKNAAIAINPIDWKMQDVGDGLFAMKYPQIFGSDVAGTVDAVGANVTSFKKGDRVIAHALQLTSSDPQEGGFQHYTKVYAGVTALLPQRYSFQQGSVMPLALNTALVGLYYKDYLDLPLPSLSPKPTGATLLIWGASSSVGSMATQLAIASGIEVIATASAKNAEYCKKLGASQVFDYNSSTITEDLVNAFKEKTIAGVYDAISYPDTLKACVEVLTKSKSNGPKFLATVLPPPENLPEGVGAKWIMGSAVKNNAVAQQIWSEYIPKAMEDGKLVPAPEPLVIGKGLEKVQEGMDLNKKGVSAAKVVIDLE